MRFDSTRRARARSLIPALGALLPMACGLAISFPAHASEDHGQCPGYSKCPETSYAAVERNNADAARVRREIARMEAEGLHEMRESNLGAHEAAVTLGKLEIHDTSISALGNRACASCHIAETGFTGGISIFNEENTAYPGSVVHRSSSRRPMSYAYAPFAPPFHYDASQSDFVGGNFWDMRATGLKTGIASGDQAEDPPVDPAELALPDAGCIIYRIQQGPYHELFKRVWGSGAFNITFPADTSTVCSRPYSSNAPNPQMLKLDPASRAQVNRSYDDFGIAAAIYEASPEVSAFSSKFDAYLAGRESLSPVEMHGLKLFNGKANCSQCHAMSGAQPLFTSFGTANIGTPANPDLPYLHENVPDGRGYVANKMGPRYIDNGVGDFLSGQLPGSTKPTPAQRKLAPLFNGRFQVQTLRNIDKRPYPSFVRDYGHNGFFKSLDSIVHFYNTRDVLPKCTEANPEDGDGQVGVTCWPEPEQPANENQKLIGNLGLSPDEEHAIVAFLGTLSDRTLKQE